MVIGAAAVIASVNRAKDPESPRSINLDRIACAWGPTISGKSARGTQCRSLAEPRPCVSVIRQVIPSYLVLTIAYMSRNGDSPSDGDGDVDGPRNVGIMEFLHSAHSESQRTQGSTIPHVPKQPLCK